MPPSPRSGRGAGGEGPSVLQLRRDGTIVWLTLNRPKSANRIDAALAADIVAACEQIELDDAVRVVVLRGFGQTFCAGIEGEVVHDPIAAIANLTAPVIAVLRGEVTAEGAELALACDLRVASSTAVLKLPQLSEDRLPRYGATQRLPRIVGRTRAMDLLLTGRAVRAKDALRMGLVSSVVADARLDEEIAQLAASLASKGPIAMRYAKEAVRAGSDMTIDQGIRLEQDLYVLLQTTADRAAGVASFRQKRKPRYTGG